MRIAALWEGTTQIQALDLLGRKIMLQKLAPINEHCSQLYSQCKPLLFSGDSQLRKHAWNLLWHTMEWQLLTYRIGMRAKKDKEWISSTSVDYLMFGGYVTLASHWLKMEEAAVAKLANPEGAEEEPAFYEAKRHTSSFVFERLLPRTRSHKDVMLSPPSSLMGIENDGFSFDHAQ